MDDRIDSELAQISQRIRQWREAKGLTLQHTCAAVLIWISAQNAVISVEFWKRSKDSAAN